MCDMDQGIDDTFSDIETFEACCKFIGLTSDRTGMCDRLRLRMEYYRGIDTNCIGLCMKKADMQQR